MKEGGRRTPGAPVAYIMSRFPLLTETFILREMLELERQGAALLVLPLLRARQPVRHAEVERLRAEVHYTPFVSPAIVAANLHFLLRAPARYLRLLWAVLRGNAGSANLFFGALGVFPKSVYFARLVGARGVGHVHAHFATHPALSALVVSELGGVTFSFTAHAHDIFLHERMLAEKVRRALFVVSISEFNKRYMLERARGVAPDKVAVVHCGVEPEKYAARPPGPARAGALTALCVASLQPYKGIKYLVRACALVARRFPGFRCLVVGEGADRAELEALIDELNLRDTFRLLGARPQHEVAELLSGADLFVLPSVVAPTGQMEGIPVALMEAMAAGLPVVSTRISGIPELVEDGAGGLLVEPADEEALAGALVRLCEDAPLRARLGGRGREKVLAEFTLAENVARLRSLFDEAARAAGRAGDESRAVNGDGDGRGGARASLDDTLVEWARGKFDGAGVGDVRVSRLGGGRDSEVFELASGGGDGARPSLVLKLHRPNWAAAGTEVESGRAHADNEFRALSVLWGEFSRRSERLAVPRPVAFEPERAALLIEKSPGVRLERAMRWARLRPGASARLRGWFGACGEWLATFHGVTARAEDPRPVYERIEREFGEELETCRALGLGAGLAASAARRFEEWKGAAFDPRARVVGRHCDFAPYNVLAAEGRVTVIDFEGLQGGVAFDDLCYFICMVEATPAYHLGRRAKAALREEFLRGYERHAPLERARLGFHALASMVKIMAHSPVLRRGGTWLDSLKRRQRLAFYRGWLAEALARG